MFCPTCKSILTKKRVSNQIVIYCNCPDKKEPKQQIVTIKTSERRKTIISKGTSNKKYKKIITISESRVKPKREPSNYSLLPLELRLSKTAKMPPFWLKGEVKNRLINQTSTLYERFYRNLEDFFLHSELQTFISLLPNSSISDFTIDFWGIGTFDMDNNFILWYRGTKLNDRASWDSTVLEKFDDIILPFSKFNPDYKKPKLNLDRLNLKQFCEILLKEWNKYKELSSKKYRKPNFNETYTFFRNWK